MTTNRFNKVKANIQKDLDKTVKDIQDMLECVCCSDCPNCRFKYLCEDNPQIFNE
jgi:hypothetical protein